MNCIEANMLKKVFMRILMIEVNCISTDPLLSSSIGKTETLWKSIREISVFISNNSTSETIQIGIQTQIFIYMT